MQITKIEELAKLIRHNILVSTTEAGSGHPTSSLSAADIMTTLFFGGYFKADLENIKNPNNDRVIFSKGHASPLFYSLYAAAGKVSQEELKTLRKFTSNLEGHPTPLFKYTECASGSLGQGLSVGVGMAINAKYLDKLPYKTYVLMGDSEAAEGSVWEAMEIASYYKLDNLIGILDVNRLGQRGETMYGHNVSVYEQKVKAFGWETIVIDGHSYDEINDAFEKALKVKDKPVMIIAKTLKGKGVSLLEDKDGWHGKAVPKDKLDEVLKELGNVDLSLIGEIAKPENKNPDVPNIEKKELAKYSIGDSVPTRKAYGNALVKIKSRFPELVVLDAETSNSTYAEIFRNEYPEHFFEMFIAEQNMAGTALGLSLRGKIPFMSSFSAFLTRAYDQVRMSQYSNSNVKVVGSHAGVSIGEDGGSQMGLEDLAMFRTLHNSVVLYPSDAVSTEKLVEAAAKHDGNVYMRTTRMATEVIYDSKEEFHIGKCKVIRESKDDVVTVIGAGVTLHEALKAYDELNKEGISIRIIDLYSIKPIDSITLKKAAEDTGKIITVEDHYPEGGIGEAVMEALSKEDVKVYSLAVRKMPRSGKPAELLDYEGISSKGIIKKVKEISG
ncbi:MAG: transketolase [Nanoarchaeota archaeon]|nr:transketolase [Nanoarchaeota archaeon]